MIRRQFLTAVSAGLAIPMTAKQAEAGDQRFAAVITSQVGGKPVRLVLTGTALRTKYFLSVYTIGSYVQDGVKVRDAEHLARVNAVKQLQLIFERDVDGASMARSFRESIGMIDPAPAFAAELAELERYFVANPCRTGNRLILTFLPGVGLSCQLAGKEATLIEEVRFAQAAWSIYLGPKNLSVAIKSGLSSRL